MADALLDGEQAKVLELVNQLGSWGVHHVVPLPQLVVCGDTSCGKSSLLSAISGCDFLVKAGKETRFPTQVVLRRTATESSHVSILPGEGASPEDRTRLEAFEPSRTALEDLPEIIKEAIDAMKLTHTTSLSDDVLRVEICGPTRPHLTLVDLPGLIASTKDSTSPGETTMIEQLVRKYILNKQSIVLAVVSAGNDAANQRVLEMVKKADPSGERTIAVITKPDLMQGPSGQDYVLNLMQNETYHFQLGWHMVRNIDRDTSTRLIFDRDAEEADFFGESPWNTLPRDQFGVPALQKRLSAQLCRHISKEIPYLTRAIKDKLSECELELDRLGDARNTSTAQRLHLTRIAVKVDLVFGDALAVHYQEDLFSKPEMRLRARIRDLQNSLFFSIKLRGPSLDIACNNMDLGRGDLELAERELKKSGDVERLNLPDPRSMTCDAHAELVKHGMIRENRGSNLPTLTNPELVSQIFRDLSSPWSEIVDTHLRLTFDAVSTFIADVFRHHSDENTYKNLYEERIGPALDAMNAELRAKKIELMAPYTTLACLSWSPWLAGQLGKIDLWTPDMPSEITDPSAQADHIAAQRLVHKAYVYYTTAQYTMVDNIAILAIENCLLSKLRGIFNAETVAGMSDDVLMRLAGEPEDAAEKRQVNEALRLALTKALERCLALATGLRKGALAGEIQISGVPPAHKVSPLPQGRQGHPEVSRLDASVFRNPEHTRSPSGDFGSISQKEAEEGPSVPPLTPNRSPTCSPPRVGTPGDEDTPIPVQAGMPEKSQSTGSQPNAEVSLGPDAPAAGDGEPQVESLAL